MVYKFVLLLATCLTFIGNLAGQTALTCFTNAAVNTPVRFEGLIEQTGDYLITCTGGAPTPLGSPAPTVNIRLNLNTSITSKLLAGSWSEALLLINEPAPAGQRICGTSGDVEPSPGVCTITGTGTGVGVYSGVPGRPNVFQGAQVSANTLQWTGIPIDPPGALGGALIIRITNVRANVNFLGASASGVTPVPFFATITPEPANVLPISGATTQSVGSVQRGLQILYNPPFRTFQQCTSENAALAVDPNSNGTSQFNLRFNELFATSMKRRNVATTPENPGAEADQNSLASFLADAYNSESGFMSSAFFTSPVRGNLAKAGVASQGTRLMARFTNVPAGVKLFSQVSGIIASGTADAVRMVSADPNGNGVYTPVAGNTFGIAPIPITNGTGVAHYEFVASSAISFVSVDIPIYVAYTANVPFNQPGLGIAVVNASFAPLSATVTASATEPVPRFADTSTGSNLFQILSCSCASLGSYSASVGPAGGSGTIPVAASSSCFWPAYSLTSWISVDTLPNGANHQGSALLGYQVAPNPTNFERVGHIAVENWDFTITQGAQTCTITASPLTATFEAGAGAGSFGVTVNPSYCAWTPVSSAAWVVITNPGLRQGSGFVNYSVAGNTGLARGATITGFDQPFTITQAGATGTTGFRFVPVTPCRIIDTRLPAGPFGGPAIEGARNIAIPQSACGIPPSATAYSLNVTAVPAAAALPFLTIWPAGQAQPFVSTLNSFDGRIKANAAIVAAGAGGQVSVYVNAVSHVILDINGYFVPAAGANNLAFYAVTPCRISDTRSPVGPFGGPSMTAGQTRSFNIPGAGCGIPASAQAYSLNMTAVPSGPLAFLTTWPTGQPQPFVSTLNAFAGTVTANAAIVPAGASGAVNVYVTHPTDVVIDINGYFAPPGSPGELAFYPVTPCRISDTRNAAGPFGGPSMAAGQARVYPVTSSGCALPSTARAYSLNGTVVPAGPLAFLTLWPAGQAQPGVSTLNSFDGTVASNAAIVPAGASGSISAYVTNLTDLILDVNGYFAP